MTRRAARRQLAGILITATMLLAPATGRGLVPVANGELFVGGEVRTTYDSNVFSNRDRIEDVSVAVTPQLEFVRDAGAVHLEARTGVVWQRYLDVSRLNSEDFYAEVGLSYPVTPGRARSEHRLDLYYRERTAPIEDVGDVAETTRYGGDYGLRYRLTEKTALRSALGAERLRHRGDRLSDQDIYAASADGIWVYSEKLEFFSGYRFRRTETQRAADQWRFASNRDHRISVGAAGDLLPKVTGSVRTGYQYRDFDDSERDSRDQISFDVDATWEATAQSSLTLGAGRDFRTSADERNVDATIIYLEATHRLTDPVRLDAALSYTHDRFSADANRSGRTDHRYGAEGGVRYSLTERASAAFAYRFIRRESSEAFFTHSRHIVDLSTRVRF